MHVLAEMPCPGLLAKLRRLVLGHPFRRQTPRQQGQQGQHPELDHPEP